MVSSRKGTPVGVTVLIVEDFADTRMMMREALKADGFRVVEATNGYEAIRVAKRELPHLILIDLYIPALDGFVTISLMRQHPEMRDVPIIALSAYDSGAARADAADAGVTAYVTKPVDLDHLHDLICRLLADG